MQHFDYKTRVLYGDTDKMGITYYANYLVWFEAARTEYFRAIGLPYTDCEKKGLFLPVVEAYAKYMAPSTYDDEITVRTSVSEITPSRICFQYQIFKAGLSKTLCQGFTTHVFVDKQMSLYRVPDEILEKIQTHSLFSK